MKNAQKLITLVVMLAMVMALMTSALAASITINTNLPTGTTSTGETYNAYKILDASISGKNYSYTIDFGSKYFSVINTYAKLEQINGTTTYSVDTSSIVDDEMSNLSAALLAVAKTDTPTKTVTGAADANSVTIDDLDDGYYLITSTLGSAVIVDTTKTDHIDTKNAYPTLQKAANKTTAAFGEEVTFAITVTIPATANSEIVVHDVMSGLEYAKLTTNTTAGITANTTKVCTDNDCTVEFKIPDTVVAAAANSGEAIVIEYTAKVAGNAREATNTSYLTYAAYTSAQTSTVSVKNYNIDVYKWAGSKTTGLAGAGFVLKNADGKYYSIDSNGIISWVDGEENATEYITAADNYTITFAGLADGKYTLVEKTVPGGYTQANNTEVTIAGDDQSVSVENKTGSLLPSTGGIGTTIFYALGGVMVLAALVFLVTNKRMRAE